MANIRFLIRTKVDRLAPIYIRYVDGKKIDIKIPTPYRLFPSYWDNSRQLIRKNIIGTAEFTPDQAQDIENKLYQLKDYILRESFKLSSEVTEKWLKANIEKFHTKGKISKETMNQYIKRFVDEAENGKRLATSGNTKKRYAYGTLRALRGFMLSWNTFQGIENIYDKKPRKDAKVYPQRPYKQLEFNDITIDTYNDFVQFFYDRECGANYIGKHIKSLKTIMRQAREDGLHNNTVTELRAFKTVSEPSDSIYLTESELEALRGHNLSSKKHYEIARDVFLVGCYTAQRYSDYSKINKDNIKLKGDSRFIELNQEKTGEKCIIPIRPELDEILRKYDYTLPSTHEQKVNKYIKEVGKAAGINETIMVEKNKGGKIVKTKVCKADLIKTHTARRTGCTQMYLAGIPTIDIMKLSGHKTEKEFLKYIKVGKEETAINLANHPFFRGNPLRIAN